MTDTSHHDRSLLDALLGDGRFLLALTGVALIGSGGFALFLCATGHFLPHDVQALGFDADQLARLANHELVQFMFHDRAAFGGALIALGTLYLWLVEFPLRSGHRWAWWTLAASGTTGFGSFLFYLGYGYLDTWHGVATLFLLPLFVAGLARGWRTLRRPVASMESSHLPWRRMSTNGSARLGWRLLCGYGAGLVAAGVTISFLGMTRVFVATDLAFIGLTVPEICGVSDLLVPVIAHDRAGFGGGLLSTGVIILAILWHAPLTRSLVHVLALSGAAGFGGAIGIHYVIGYTDVWHVAPAWIGAALWGAGIVSGLRAVAVRAGTKTAVAGSTTPAHRV